MQETFGPQFIDRYMKPLIQRIVTDMAEPKPDTQYLQRIMIGGEGDKLKALEKEQFFNEYFRKDKTKPFSTTEEGDVKFQNKFLDEFTESFQTRRKLSDVEGVRRALLPGKDKSFNEEVSRNIFQMAYKMCLDFEKQRVQEILQKEKGEMSVKDREDLEAGKLKLIIVNGVEHVIHEDEAKNAASNPTMKNVVVKEYLSKQIEGGTADGIGTAGGTSGGIEGAGTGTATGGAIEGAGATGSAVGGPAAGLESPPTTLETVANDFGDAKAAGMETLLEKNGLEMVGGLSYDPADKEKRFLKGKVRDVNGQLLNVRIDTKAGKDEPHKFAFTFAGPPPSGTKGKDRTGETFFLSQNDLKKFEPEPGKRQSAEEIAHPKVGELAKEKKTPIQGVGLPKPGIQPGGGSPKVGSIKITGSATSFKPFKLEAKGKVKGESQLPGGTKAANMPAGLTGGGAGVTETVIMGGTPGAPVKTMLPGGVKPLPQGSIAAKKQAVAAKKQGPATMPPPPGGSFAAGGGYAGKTAAKKPKKGGWKVPAAIVGGHVALGGVLGGVVSAASHSAAASNPENISNATTFVTHLIHCIGLICRA